MAGGLEKLAGGENDLREVNQLRVVKKVAEAKLWLADENYEINKLEYSLTQVVLSFLLNFLLYKQQN